MRLIITRPEKDARSLREKLEALGHDTRTVPLLEIVPRPHVSLPQSTYQAVCITSANGLANTSLIPPVVGLKLLCVGPQSATAAQKAGFANVEAHGGDVNGLTTYIVEHLRPGDGPLLYLSGATTSGDLEGKLRAAGFAVDRVIAYDAIATSPATLREAVTSSDAVLLYSPRSAKLWREEIEKAGLDRHMNVIIHLCLSAAVARALPEGWSFRIAVTPDEKGMLEALEKLEPSGEQE